MKYLILVCLSCILNITVFGFDKQYKSEQLITPQIDDSLRADIVIEIPGKAISKKAIICMTPKIGELSFQSICLQGEKTEANHIILNHKYGGTLTYFDVIKYILPPNQDKISIEVIISEDDIVLSNKTITIKNGEGPSVFFFGDKNKTRITINLVNLAQQ